MKAKKVKKAKERYSTGSKILTGFFILVAVLALAQQKMTRSKEVEA